MVVVSCDNCLSTAVGYAGVVAAIIYANSNFIMLALFYATCHTAHLLFAVLAAFFILRAYFDIYCCQLTSAIKYVATVHTQLIAGQMATCQRCCHALKQCQSHNFFTLPSLFTHFSRLQSCHLSSLSAATVWHCCYNFVAVVFFAFVCNATIATVVSVSVCHDSLCRCHRF